MTTTIRRDYDPERDRCEEERETERRAWARFAKASVGMAAAQVTIVVGPAQEAVDAYRSAERELDAAIDVLEKCGVDVTKYLEAT